MREMMVLMRSAREDAQQESRTTELWLNVDEKTFGRKSNSKIHNLPATTKINFETFEQGLMNESTGVVRFYPDGTSSGGQITTDFDGLIMSLRVSWITGRIQLL
jgi:general secretion pathway protein H